MRILLATNNLNMAAELGEVFADVDIAAVVSSYTDLLDSVRRDLAADMAGVEAIIFSDALDSARDRRADPVMTLERAILEARELLPTTSLVLISSFGSVSLNPEIIAQASLKLVTLESGSLRGSALPEILDLRARDQVAQIFTLTGLQGGAGRTTMAVNLAALLGSMEQYRMGDRGVLLWDLSLRNGSVAQMLGISPADRQLRSISSLLAAEDPGSVETIARNILSNKTTRLDFDVLLAPDGLREVLAFFRSNDRLNQAQQRLTAVLRGLRQMYRAIIIDTDTDLLTTRLPVMAMAEADRITVVGSASPSGIGSLQVMADVLADAGWGNKSAIILNRHPGREADARQVADALDIPVLGDLGLSNVFPTAERDQRLLVLERGGREADMLRAALQQLINAANNGSRK
jgi:MinD-like ATPase involved in chromosome partitioning or flagellar assembly